MSKNLQHSKETTKNSTSLRTRTFNLFKNKNKNLQPPKAKTKTFNLQE
jgi:hypothetical protein